MPLDSAQKNKILRILGYPLGSIDPTSLSFSNIIVGNLNRVDGDAQVEVEGILTKIDEADDAIEKKISQAGVKRIDDIEFYENSHLVLEQQKNRYIRDLATCIDIPSVRSGRNGVIVV